MSVGLSICLSSSVCLSVYLLLRLSNSLSAHKSVCPCLPVYRILSVCLCICPCVLFYLSTCLSVCLCPSSHSLSAVPELYLFDARQRPSTSGVGRSNHLKNEESLGWAPGIANGAAAYQGGSLDAASALLQRRPGSSASSVPPRTPVSRGQLFIPQQAATLRPSTAQQQQQQEVVLAREGGSMQNRFAPAVPPIIEEQQQQQQEQETWQPTAPPGATSLGSNISQPQLTNNEGDPSSTAAGEEFVIMSDALVKAPIATPRLPIPAIDQSPPRSPAAAKYRAVRISRLPFPSPLAITCVPFTSFQVL